MNLSLLPAAHQLLLPLFHRTNESIGLENLLGRDKDDRVQLVMGKPDLALTPCQLASGAVRKEEGKVSQPFFPGSASFPQSWLL